MRAFALLLSGFLIYNGAYAQSSGASAAIGAMAESAAENARQQQAFDRQKALILQQHNLEMERIRAAGRMRIEEQDRSARRQNTTHDVPTEQAKVRAAHPDVENVINSASFTGWLDKQPPSIKKLGQSDSSSHLILLLDFYKSSRK